MSSLVEVVVALIVFALLVSLTTVRVSVPQPTNDLVRALRETQATAFRTGRPTTWRSTAGIVRFQPDGTATGSLRTDTMVVTVDPLTGQVRVAQ